MSYECAGWWQQAGLGRQEMEQLKISMHGKRFSGFGTDIVSDFELQGRFRTDGYVEILKQYRDRHVVVYVGQYDGEGILSGEWDISGYRGKWSIRLMRPLSAESDIQEL